MDVKTASIFVEDQSNALTFCTDILGFWKVNDIDLGEFRWPKVSTAGSGETGLLLKPNAHPAAKTIRTRSMRMAYRQLFSTASIFTKNIGD